MTTMFPTGVGLVMYWKRASSTMTVASPVVVSRISNWSIEAQLGAPVATAVDLARLTAFHPDAKLAPVTVRSRKFPADVRNRNTTLVMFASPLTTLT